MKNFLIRLFLFFRPKRKESGLLPQTFLIVSTTGLGDTLWATPAIRALRAAYPHSTIDLLTSPLGEQVLKNNPHINTLFTIADPLFYSLVKLFFALQKKQYDVIFIFHTSQRLILPFCALLGAPKIIGTKGLNKGLDSILTHALGNKPKHEIERRMEMVKEVNACSKQQQLDFFPAQEEELEQFLKTHQVSASTLLIGLHPGAQNLFKQWQPRSFIELGLKLRKKIPCTLFVTGSQEESALVTLIAKQIPDAIAISGQLPLTTLAALQKKMALFITNDTGPMHLAFAMKTPTIALFGPTDPRLCGPHQAQPAIVIQKKKTCSPCLMKKCSEPFCLLQIGVDEVYQKALELLHVS